MCEKAPLLFQQQNFSSEKFLVLKKMLDKNIPNDYCNKKSKKILSFNLNSNEK